MAVFNPGIANQKTRDEIDSEPDVQLVPIPLSENVTVEVEPLQISENTIGESFILGSTTNGVLGTWTGTQGGGQLVLGESGRVSTVQKVINAGDRVTLRFNNNNFEDTGSTTADWNVASSGVISFTNTEIAQSLAVYLDNGTITSATLTVDDSTNLSAKLTADGGSNFESVTFGTEHSFTNTGSDLRFQLTASGNSTVTWLRIRFN